MHSNKQSFTFLLHFALDLGDFGIARIVQGESHRYRVDMMDFDAHPLQNQPTVLFSDAFLSPLAKTRPGEVLPLQQGSLIILNKSESGISMQDKLTVCPTRQRNLKSSPSQYDQLSRITANHNHPQIFTSYEAVIME